MGAKLLAVTGGIRRCAVSAGPSCADVLAFEALPEDIQALALRVLGGNIPGQVGLDEVAEAYKQGWDDCAEAMEPPYLSDSEAMQAARDLRTRRR